MLHVSKEFSIELILCLFEFNQFLSILKQQLTNKSHLKQMSIDLNELNKEIMKDSQNNDMSNIFYSKIDAILFDRSYNDAANIRIYEFADSVPNSFIIETNLCNLKHFKNEIEATNNDSDSNVGNDTNNKEYIYNRPAIMLGNNDNHKYKQINFLLLLYFRKNQC